MPLRRWSRRPRAFGRLGILAAFEAVSGRRQRNPIFPEHHAQPGLGSARTASATATDHSPLAGDWRGLRLARPRRPLRRTIRAIAVRYPLRPTPNAAPSRALVRPSQDSRMAHARSASSRRPERANIGNAEIGSAVATTRGRAIMIDAPPMIEYGHGLSCVASLSESCLGSRSDKTG